MTKPTLRVTDHAMLRYYERVRGIDVEGDRKRLAAMLASYAAIGVVRVKLDGFVYNIAPGGTAVTTVTPDTNSHCRTAKDQLIGRGV